MSNGNTLFTISGKFYVGMPYDKCNNEDKIKFQQMDCEPNRYGYANNAILSFREICTEIAYEELDLKNSDEYKTEEGKQKIDALINAKHEEIKEYMKQHNIPVTDSINLVYRDGMEKLIPHLKMGL